jgi:hypothetical protein
MIFNRQLVIFICLACSSGAAIAQEDSAKDPNWPLYDLSVHGFYEVRAGYRTRNDPYEKDMSIMEQRLQLELSSKPEWGDLKIKGDTVGDLVEECGF